MLSTLVFALMLTAADTPVQTSLSPEEQDEALRHLYYREPFSDIVRDGMNAMLLEPLPFTKRLPPNSPDVDHWEGRGYGQQVTIADPDDDPLGHQAIDAGFCRKNERPCVFSFVYLFSTNPSFDPGHESQVAIRYLYQKGADRVAEGFIWGSDKQSRHFIRTATGWRAVRDNDEKKLMNHAVELANGLHQARLHELELTGRIVRQR